MEKPPDNAAPKSQLTRVFSRLSGILNTDIRDLFKKARPVDEIFIGELSGILRKSGFAQDDVDAVVEALMVHSGRVLSQRETLDV
jgi:hypothetical protein